MKSYNLVLPDDVSLYFETHGKGAPLLLIAGLGSDSQSWGTVVKDLAKDFLVITPDNRGVGRSTQKGVKISIAAMADDCMAILDFLEIPAAHLVGHSMGGFVALECAMRYGQRVSSLVLAATSTKCSDKNNALFRVWASELHSGIDLGEWLMELFPWLFTERFLQDREMVESFIRMAREYPYPQTAGAFRKQVEALAEFDGTGRLAAVRAPTLIIHGCEDLLFPASECVERLALISGARSMVLGKAAHSIPLEQPEEFAAAIRSFLQQ